MIDHLSVSSIKTYQRCAKQWEFRYIKNLKLAPAGVMIAGTAYHQALADYFNAVLDDQAYFSMEACLDSFSGSWDRQLSEHKTREDETIEEFDRIDWGNDDPGELKDKGIECTKYYHTNIAPKIKPLLVEERVEAPLDSIKFVAITDLITENEIIDHKLKAKRFSLSDLQNDMQPTAYKMFYPYKQFNYHVALRQKTPSVEINEAVRTQDDISFFVEMVLDTLKAIRAGSFPARIEGWHCNENFCGYYKLCRGK